MGKYFAYSPDGGMVLFSTEEGAKNWAQSEIDDVRDSMGDDGWPEDLIGGICWGEVGQMVAEVTEPGVYGSNYQLRDVEI